MTGNDVPGIEHVDPLAPTDTVTLHTTPEQDKLVQDFINQRIQNPGNYNLYGRNCATTVIDALGGWNQYASHHLPEDTDRQPPQRPEQSRQPTPEAPVTLAKTTGIAAAVGAAVPVLSRLLWAVTDASVRNIRVHVFMQNVTLMLWPSWILTLPGDSTKELALGLFVISLVVNVLLYAVLGLMLWLGLNKHVAFLGVAGVAVLALWWRILTL